MKILIGFFYGLLIVWYISKLIFPTIFPFNAQRYITNRYLNLITLFANKNWSKHVCSVVDICVAVMLKGSLFISESATLRVPLGHKKNHLLDILKLGDIEQCEN